MAYDDGKAPRYKIRSPFGQNTGASEEWVKPGQGQLVGGVPIDPTGSVERPTPRGTGLFKAKECFGRARGKN